MLNQLWDGVGIKCFQEGKENYTSRREGRFAAATGTLFCILGCEVDCGDGKCVWKTWVDLPHMTSIKI